MFKYTFILFLLLSFYGFAEGPDQASLTFDYPIEKAPWVSLTDSEKKLIQESLETSLKDFSPKTLFNSAAQYEKQKKFYTAFLLYQYLADKIEHPGAQYRLALLFMGEDWSEPKAISIEEIEKTEKLINDEKTKDVQKNSDWRNSEHNGALAARLVKKNKKIKEEIILQVNDSTLISPESLGKQTFYRWDNRRLVPISDTAEIAEKFQTDPGQLKNVIPPDYKKAGWYFEQILRQKKAPRILKILSYQYLKRIYHHVEKNTNLQPESKALMLKQLRSLKQRMAAANACASIFYFITGR